MKTSVSSRVEEAGSITLPAKLLGDIISRLPSGEITLNDSKRERVTLTCQSGSYQMQGLNSEEFPELPQVEKAKAIELSAEALLEGLRGSLFAASNDESKQVLVGIRLTVRSESIEFAATDGHRLAVVETINEKEIDTEELQVTVPAKALRELERTIASVKTEKDQPLMVKAYLEPEQVVFELGDRRLTSRTLEGRYPDYRLLIPESFKLLVSVQRRELIGALERIAILANQKSRESDLVKFSIDSEAQILSLSVEAQDVGSGRESIQAQIAGDSLEIAFSVKYAMDSLKNIPTENVTIKINSATTPVILVPLGGSNMIHLLMPMHLKN
ncbi:MAG: DNA polymerase III subunit beta [Oscillatoria sp. SIO1A7]|nr:DNA polymerase III subunit beta [Oscillatoria sp. SIO1A7]